jgi:hypothetical protein
MTLKNRLARLESITPAAPEEGQPTNEELIAWLESVIGCEIPHTAEAASALLGHSASIIDAAAYLAGMENGRALIEWLEGKR